MDRRPTAARFPELAPPEPGPARARAQVRVRALPPGAALPVMEWAVFGGLLLALLMLP